jgi:hypothetical protein
MSNIPISISIAPEHRHQIRTASARAALSDWERGFLDSLRRQRRPLSERQAGTLARIVAGTVDIATVKRATMARLREVVERLLPGGTERGGYWVCADLRGGKGDSCKVRLTGDRAGCWSDFATGDKGGDPISLAAAITGTTQLEAAQNLARMLGVRANG